MKHSFKRRLIVVILAISMVFTMSVPAFAEGPDTTSGKTLTYLAIGDSIGAGCKNLSFLQSEYYATKPKKLDGFAKLSSAYEKEVEYNDQFDKFSYFADYAIDGSTRKNTDVNAVEFSYVSRIADAIGANKESSINGTFVGLRAKDICHILGIPAALGDTYEGTFISKDGLNIYGEGDIWHAFLKSLPSSYKYVFTEENKKIYKDGIANADVITIELGENDMSSFFLAGGLSDISSLSKAISSGDVDVKELIELVHSMADGLVFNTQYYFINMMKYIEKHKKDNAAVVVSTMINPLNNASEENEVVKLLTEYLGNSNSLSSAIDVYIKAMNTLIKAEALTYDYIVADISDVSLLPVPDKFKKDKDGDKPLKYEYTDGKISKSNYEDGEQLTYLYKNTEEDEWKTKELFIDYVFHPNGEGQQEIADEFVKQIKNAPKAKILTTAVKTVAVGIAVNTVISTIAVGAKQASYARQKAIMKNHLYYRAHGVR